MAYVTWNDLLQVVTLAFAILSCYINSKKR